MWHFLFLNAEQKLKTMEKQQGKGIEDILEGSIISIKEAKKLLGAQYECMPDDTSLEIIMTMSRIAPVMLEWASGSTRTEWGV